MRLPLICGTIVLVGVATFALGQDQPPPGGPPIDTIKKLLQGFWGPRDNNPKHEFAYKSMKFGDPLKEVDVIGRPTGKVYYPMRVQCDITITFPDGVSRVEKKNQTFHFFRDVSNFNEWTFRFIANNP